MKKQNNFTNVYNLLRIFMAKMHEMSNEKSFVSTCSTFLDLFQKSIRNHPTILLKKIFQKFYGNGGVISINAKIPFTT